MSIYQGLVESTCEPGRDGVDHFGLLVRKPKIFVSCMGPEFQTSESRRRLCRLGRSGQNYFEGMTGSDDMPNPLVSA
jgi:hypothetical protein